MVSRRFACLFLAVSKTLSSIWIVSADQSHQIQDAAEAAASYSAAVQALEEAGLSQSAQANSNIAIDLGMLEQEETVDLSQLAVQAVQLQQEEEARQAEAARQANREAARRTGRQAARQALLDAYDGAMAARQITVYAAPSDSASRKSRRLRETEGTQRKIRLLCLPCSSQFKHPFRVLYPLCKRRWQLYFLQIWQDRRGTFPG